ncbi:hypothetical protein HHI36_006685 [Cryptolaemus montrouzieri]|uniref:Midasin n=1 Tax=Cryptolaemus montrouzieri TaxID=559131 RepID=A0ABD2NXU3_9CUCU
MIDFNVLVEEELAGHKFGNKGAPWECNLRDLTRWCEATIFHYNSNRTEKNREYRPEALVNLLYGDRMRTLFDKDRVKEIFASVFGRKVTGTEPIMYLNRDRVYFGDVFVDKNVNVKPRVQCADKTKSLVLRSQLSVLRSLSYCVNLGWMSILVGTSGCGKSSVVKTLANLAGRTLKTFPVTSAMDTTDILGGFEQVSGGRIGVFDITKLPRVDFHKFVDVLRMSP